MGSQWVLSRKSAINIGHAALLHIVPDVDAALVGNIKTMC